MTMTLCVQGLLQLKLNSAMSDSGSTRLEIKRAKTSCYSLTAQHISRSAAEQNRVCDYTNIMVEHHHPVNEFKLLI